MTTWEAVLAAVGEALGGADRDKARAELEHCWESTTDADHGKRCVIAHYLADLQPTVDDEVRWDEQALAAYTRGTAGDLEQVGVEDPMGMAPSLHLNLGDGYLRQGRVHAARQQLLAGRGAEDALNDDGYGRLIRDGLSRLEQRIIDHSDGVVRCPGW